MVIPTVTALVAMTLVLGADYLHSRRCRLVASLAFGPKGTAREWTRAVPFLRALAVAMLAWGYTALLFTRPLEGSERKLPEDAVRHVIFALDVSPSMDGVADSGRQHGDLGSRLLRSARAKELAGNMINLMAHDQISFTLLAFYNEARPVMVDCPDPALILEMMDRPLANAFKPGETNIIEGVSLACEVAAAWPPGSTTLVILSDGDVTDDTGMPKPPESIGRILLVGVGDPQNATDINGHMSRQTRNELIKTAHRLGGSYHDGNLIDLPIHYLGDLTSPRSIPRVVIWTSREVAILMVVAGSLLLSLLPVALEYFGESSNYIKAREKLK